MKKRNEGVWDEASKRYVLTRFLFGDSVEDITDPKGEWSDADVEEILREAFRTLKP